MVPSQAANNLDKSVPNRVEFEPASLQVDEVDEVEEVDEVDEAGVEGMPVRPKDPKVKAKDCKAYVQRVAKDCKGFEEFELKNGSKLW